MSWCSFFHEWQSMRRYQSLPSSARQIVFYAENSGSWTHFEPIVRELVEVRGREIAYLTSASDDPVLATTNKRIHPFCIGDGNVRKFFFDKLQDCVMVMTMPDLETFEIKRAKNQAVHYTYVFHSIVSSHMIYQKEAFAHFDTMLCVGPHHIREIRAAEAKYGFPPKQLVEHGYGRLDTILSEGLTSATRDEALIRVLVAPSWGPNGLLEARAGELLEILLRAGFHVTVRPHPMTLRRDPGLLETLRRQAIAHDRLDLDVDMSSRASLYASDIMISDWSGAALEYAFGLERPVLFIDVPRKVNNPEYEMLGIEPLEVSIRIEIGKVVGTDEMQSLPAAVETLCADPKKFRTRLREARSRHVFNLQTSGAAAADCLERLAREIKADR